MPKLTRFINLSLLGMLVYLVLPSLSSADPVKIETQKTIQQIVQDRTIELSPKEVILRKRLLLQLLMQNDEGIKEEIQAVKNGSVFQLLMKYPDKNRGMLFRIEGEIRHVVKLSAENENREKDFGINTIYETQFYPFDSEGMPLILHSATLPEGVNPGRNLLLQGSVDGIFFKIQSLPEGSKPAVAPLLLVQSISLDQEDETTIGFPLEFFSVVNHKSLGISTVESDLYYRILKFVQMHSDEQRAEAKQFQKICRGKRPRYQKKTKLAFATYYDLFKHYKEYVGKPVTLKGVARKHIQYPADENDYGITTLHELWVYDVDAQHNPAVFVCTTVPKGLPEGEEITETVQMTGTFFKMYGYQAKDTVRRVPMLLGGKIEWLPDESPAPNKNTTRWMMIASVLFCMVVFALWRMRRRDKEFQNERDQTELPDEPDFSQLKED